MWQRRVRTDGSKADVSRLANAEYSLEITYSQSDLPPQEMFLTVSKMSVPNQHHPPQHLHLQNLLLDRKNQLHPDKNP